MRLEQTLKYLRKANLMTDQIEDLTSKVARKMEHGSMHYYDLVSAERKIVTTKVYLEQALNQLEERERAWNEIKMYLHLVLFAVALVIFYLTIFSIGRH